MRLGSSESKQSGQVYELAENRHEFFANILEKINVVVFIVISLVPATLPISYALFGYPPPRLWTLPIPIQWVRRAHEYFKVYWRRSVCSMLSAWIFSSLLTSNTYAGFFIDWFIEAGVVVSGIIAINASASFYFGIFCYIDGMVRDLRDRLAINEDLESYTWPIYMREIEFHGEIMGYTIFELINLVFLSFWVLSFASCLLKRKRSSSLLLPLFRFFLLPPFRIYIIASVRRFQRC